MIGFREIYRWFRTNLVLLIFLSIVTLQFLTWRELADLKRYLPRDPPDCGTHSPCTVELSAYSIRQLRDR